MAFALEGVFSQQWMKDSVKVDLRQVEEVFFDVARYWIAGEIGTRHGIDEGRHAHFNHLKERLFHRKFV